ncbi:uncharacterized protein BDZ99DRAFT_503162 [Mytilinidion resinicola]|uniref:FAR1 domain-containing protein n=1 Tax=Mytilinidion resinicola TaxID=574789 RepID=A0A6A6Y5N2_9PEZI|nr:uncharacterized protein BDZ99DRAFT_503162 [Mytilinidion resinicola]KAF2803535.1 hypothetical protein BDZ99DRAFT_503162 [Mytilinidion resinicola]
MPLRPPPWGRHASIEDGMKSINAWAKQEGYAIVRHRNKMDKRTPPQVRKVLVHCDCAGVYTPANRKKKTRSKKCDCPMKACFTRDLQLGDWFFEVEVSGHNHHPFDPDEGTPAVHRDLDEDTIRTIYN